jgi:hypothetical protein
VQVDGLVQGSDVQPQDRVGRLSDGQLLGKAPQQRLDFFRAPAGCGMGLQLDQFQPFAGILTQQLPALGRGGIRQVACP